MEYKVLEIYKDLPRSNCGECGRAGCFAFASAVYLDGVAVSGCPSLTPSACAAMETRLEAGREGGKGRRSERGPKALEHLTSLLADVDLAERARVCLARYRAGPPETLELDLLGTPYRVTRDDVTAPAGEVPTVWVKIFLLIYLTRSTGADAAGEWAAFRELPNTVSKNRSFEDALAPVARAFEGDRDGFDEAALRLGGRPEAFGSADRVYRVRALPRVELLLLFWEGQEEFPARVSLLVDRLVLEHLDQEALVFLAEALAARLLGRDLVGVIP